MRQVLVNYEKKGPQKSTEQGRTEKDDEEEKTEARPCNGKNALGERGHYSNAYPSKQQSDGSDGEQVKLTFLPWDEAFHLLITKC